MSSSSLLLSVVLVLAVMTAGNAILAEAGNTLNAPGTTNVTYIVGGQKGKIKDAPWQVGLFEEDAEIFCGGSIIAPNVILTAQHCLHAGFRIRYVGAGESFVKNYHFYPSLLTPVKSVVLYPQYVPGSDGLRGMDIALVFLEHDLILSNHIKTIPMATMKDEANKFLSPKKRAWISGWGTLSYKKQAYPNQLRIGKVNIVSHAFAKRTGLGVLKKDQIAAGKFPGNGKVDTCQGDSGGPLSVNGPKKKRILAGITSWGIGCGDGRHPGVYTRVSYYAQWANMVMQQAATPTDLQPTYTIAIPIEELNMGSFEGRSFTLLVPRGLRSVQVRMDNVPSWATTSLSISNQQPEFKCSGYGRPLQCTFFAPLEGQYTILILSGTSALTKVKLDAIFESWSQPSTVVYERHNVTISPHQRVTLAGFPVIPMTPFKVEVTKAASSSQPKVAVSGGIQPPLSPVGTLDSMISRSFKESAATVVLLGNGVSSSTASVRVSYQSLETPIITSNRWEFFGDLIQPSPRRYIPLPKVLKVGTELGIRFHMESGSVEITVEFGGVKEWVCYPQRTELYYCSGIVPQRSTDARIALQGEAREYHIVVSYAS